MPAAFGAGPLFAEALGALLEAGLVTAFTLGFTGVL